MPLQKQLVPLVFEGLDSHSDPKTAKATAVLKLENGEVVKPSEIRKRPGFSNCARTVRGDGLAVLDDVKQLTKRAGVPVALGGWDADYAALQYAGGVNEWDPAMSKLQGPAALKRLGLTLPAQFSSANVEVAVAYRAGTGDYAAPGTTALIAVSNETATYVCVYDVSTGEQRWAGVSEAKAHVIAVGRYLCLLTCQGWTMTCTVYDAATDCSSPAGASVTTYMDHAPGEQSWIYDVKVDWTTYAEPRLVIAFRQKADGIVSLGLVTFDPVTRTVKSSNSITGAPKCIGWLDTSHSGSTGHALAVDDATYGLQYVSITGGLALTAADTVDADTTGGGYSVEQITGFDNAGAVAVLTSGAYPATVGGVATNRPVLNHYAFTPWTSGSPPGTITRTPIYGAQLKSKARPQQNGLSWRNWLVWVTDSGNGSGATPMPLLNTHDYLLCVTATEVNTAPHAMACVGASQGAWPGKSWLTTIDADASYQYLGLAEVIADKAAQLGKTIAPVLERISLTSMLGNASETDATTFVPGGVLRLLDGGRYQGQPFPQFPRKPAVTTSAGAGLEGDYQWCAVFRWVDANGNLWRSAPSEVATASLTRDVGIAHIFVHGLCLTDYVGNVMIELYRAEASSDVFRLVAIDINETAADNQEFTDIGSAIGTNPILYTVSGELENHAPPPSTATLVFQNRLWMASGDTLWFSKPLVQGFGPGFNAACTIRIPGDDITALAVLDDKLLIFKATGVWALNGDGPNALGQGNYSTPQLIAPAHGTIYPRCVATMPDGVVFWHAGNPWIVTRALDVQFLGAPVDGLQLFPPSDAIVVPDKGQLRIYGPAMALVYDWIHKMWFQWRSTTWAKAALDCGSQVFICNQDGDLVSIETPGLYLDGATSIATRVGMANLSIAGIRGAQRVYSMQLWGDFPGVPSTITALVRFDGEAAPSETHSFTVSAAQTVLELRPWRQKCSSMSVELLDGPSAGGNQFKISAVMVRVGVKAGPGHLPVGQRFS